MAWRLFSSSCFLTAFGLSFGLASPARPPSAPVATVRNGTYAGVYSAAYNQDFFLGMPYAQPPARFSLSESLNSSWRGIHEATAYPPHCVGYGGDDVGYPESENCLYINVIRPAGISDTAKLPVAVWIHGGGLYMGGSADKRYNLTFIVQNSVELGTPMIGVSFNYRLSAYGFICGQEVLDAGVANLGFRDQRLALHWIQENIAAFGGAPDKVTIWGESAGAESVSAHTLAYNGRDDGLFRGVIAESGFGGIQYRYPGILNATADMQAVYNLLVTNTSCASTVNTSASLACLRDLPFAELDAALNGTAATPWPPMMDGDFIADYPTNQLADGRFVRVPALIGTNADEGTAFGTGRGPGGGGVNTEVEMAAAIAAIIPASAVSATGHSVAELVEELLALYPDIQAVGIPSLADFPVIEPGDSIATTMGLQYRRTGALFGDSTMIFFRRRASIAWSAYDTPLYSYRFDVTVNGQPDYVAATHFQEVAFVFDNINGDGYAINPFADESPSYPALAKAMSYAWVRFVTNQDPNPSPSPPRSASPQAAPLPAWPLYNNTVGGGVGQNIVFSVNGSFIELDSFRAPGINWMTQHGLTVFGD